MFHPVKTHNINPLNLAELPTKHNRYPLAYRVVSPRQTFKCNTTLGCRMHAVKYWVPVSPSTNPKHLTGGNYHGKTRSTQKQEA